MSHIITQLIAHLRCQLYLIFTNRPVFYVLKKAEFFRHHTTNDRFSGFVHVSFEERPKYQYRSEKSIYILSNGYKELALETKKKLKRGMIVYPNELANARLIKRSFRPKTLCHNNAPSGFSFKVDACDVKGWSYKRV